MAMTGELHPASALVRGAGYWCEAIAHTPADHRVFHLGGNPTRSPRLAVRWLRERVGDVADQLDRPYADPGRYWLTDEPEHERARSTLSRGEVYVFRLYDETTRYILSARPTGRTR
jgi:hypothetical protein